ncbi:MAG TPA: VCBS repeat-containing protein [Saprospiraceae bacterium]|nr:VCBS repeat-containing protein [Saprospiraceae bacterium]HMQ85265.1 VCBS repeat-containing protein [Saprospiraceae bacterium]
MQHITYLSVILTSFILVFSCNQKETGQESGQSLSGPLFHLVPASQTGIDFNNEIIEDAVYNHILRDDIFHGGGVAVVDINNDGLKDLFFAGNMVSDRLYLNKGNLKFEDITDKAGIRNNTWSTAVAVADVNNDGWMDIYVGKYMIEDPEKRENVLYINNGKLGFTDQAAAYGINDNGHCTAANFFDYDKDGDLDLYVGNQPFVSKHVRAAMESQIDKTQFTDRLFRFDNGKFTDVTRQAGIMNYNYTLSATVSDLNNDGWPDLYVASDYEEPDFYWQNNGNGTFTDLIHTGMRHISNFSMGVDLADFNNDGWIDIYCADMAPADNYRSKANMSGMNPEKFWGLALHGYHYQYMFNTLQLNNGNGTFSEIGQMANVSQTDWSWATLFGDFDCDGNKDLFVSNGQLRDTRNKDYVNKRKAVMDSLANAAREKGERPQINSLLLVDMAPAEKLRNYLFVNNGDLMFEDKADVWGMPEKTWTQGASYADLDNDGDLDIILSNMNDPAYIYENKAVDQKVGRYLKLQLQGDHGNNSLSYGAKAWIFYGDQMQVQEVSPVRGYFSCSDPDVLFGLGGVKTIDRLVVTWLDGRMIEMTDVKTNQVLTLKQADAKPGSFSPFPKKAALFKDHTQTSGIAYAHRENLYDDFKDEVLLPHRMSRLGPCTAVADVNGDQLEDIYLAGAAGQAGEMYLQLPGSRFQKLTAGPWQSDAACEDVDALFFDADGDQDMDLYVVSGGNEYSEGAPQLQDRLYLNDGKGSFSKSNQLPSMSVSGGVAKAGDVDGDGDLDLFVGGRQVPGKYGFPARSYLLLNDKGKFTDATEQIAPDLVKPGMVTDAQWLDIDQDKDADLMLVGEWMPLTLMLNNNGTLEDATAAAGLDKTVGWWNRLEYADMDGDGDFDLVAGNLGLNIKYKASEEEPFKVYVKDFDGNGTNDVYLAYYGLDGVCYPVRGRQCSSEQMPFIAEKFKTYHDFALASVDQVLGDLQEGAVSHEAYLFESVYLENLGQGQFNVKKLPNTAQTAPIFGIAIQDWNKDGAQDILVAGNYYEREVETTRSDAGIGQVLLGDGKGHFKAMAPNETGILAMLDVRDLAVVKNDRQESLVFVANNNNGLQVYAR